MRAKMYKGPDKKLMKFFYILAREHIVTGKLEDIMEKHVEKSSSKSNVRFTNGYLANYVEDLIRRLK